MSLPSADKDRKALPIFDGVLMYFPDAMAAIAEVSRNGNEQHNPGEPLHWAKEKSTDHYNTALRHLIDHKAGNRYDYRSTDGGKTWVKDGRHLAKAAWRVLAALQTDIEKEATEPLPPPVGTGWATGLVVIEPSDIVTIAAPAISNIVIAAE